MPVHEIALPVGAKNIDPQLPVVLRSSKDGNIPVVQLFGGDKFVGDVLEGQWLKGDDGVIVGPHTSLITGGQLELTGKAAVAANRDYGWLNGKAPFLIVQDSYVDIHMEVPAVTPTNLIQMGFLLRADRAITQPDSDDNYIRLVLRRTTGGLTQIYVSKNIAGSGTELYSFTTVTNAEGTFRIKFRPNDDKLDIYFHDGSGAVVEGTDELTLIDDTLDLTFSIGYPAFELETEDTTIRTLISDGVEIYYPDTGISYDQDVADLGKGDVKCYDTMGEASEALWMRVYSEDHDFTGDCVIENGLVRLIVDEAAQYGLELYYWTGSAWTQPITVIRPVLITDSKSLIYPFFKGISLMRRAEEIQLRVRICEGATESDAYNAELLLTLARGNHHLTFQIESTIPSQPVTFIYGGATILRWSYLGDDQLGDYDLVQTANNTTMTDNFMIEFDDTSYSVLCFIATNQKPDASSKTFRSYQGNYISLVSIAIADFDATEVHLGLVPYPDIINLFKEAEDATISGGQIDEFADGFPVDSSAQYEEDTASFTWSSLELHCAVDGKQIRLKALEWSSKDDYFQFGVKWKPVAQNGSSQCGSTLIFHSDRTVRAGNLDQPNNGYYVVLDQDAGSAALYKNVAGTPTLLDSASGLTFTLGTYYSVTVKFHESVAGSIAVWIGGVERLNATSEFTFEEGAIGIGNTFGTSTWDLFTVYDADEAESSSKSAVMLDAYSDYVHYTLTAGTHIPAGRYLAIFRLKSTAQVSNEAWLYVWEQGTNDYYNEERGNVLTTLTDEYAYYTIVFDVTDAQVAATTDIHIEVAKGISSVTTIVCDHFLIVPITDGESYVQDIAHNEMRTLDQGFRLTDTATFEIFAGLGFSYGGTLGSAYTDAMAVAAVEAEPTLDLSGVLTAKRIKNQLDNEGFFTGAGDDLRLYHDGTDSYIVNSQGNLILQNVGGDIQLETQDFFLDATGKVQIRDKDDSDAVLFELDSTARTLKLGTAADPLAITTGGSVTVGGIVSVGGSTDGVPVLISNMLDDVKGGLMAFTNQAWTVLTSNVYYSTGYKTYDDDYSGWLVKLNTATDIISFLWADGIGGGGTGGLWSGVAVAELNSSGDLQIDGDLDVDGGDVTVTAPIGVAASFTMTSTEDAVLTVSGDRVNDDESKHAWASFEQDQSNRWLRVGVGKAQDDNHGFLASYEELDIFIGATFPAGTKVGTWASTGLTVIDDLAVDGGLIDNTKATGVLYRSGSYGSLGNTFAGASLIVGFNTEAHQTINQNPIVMTTHATVGARCIRVSANGFEFLAETGSVTAGNQVSTQIALLNDSGDFQIDGDLVVSGTGTSTFAGKVRINETGSGPFLRLGDVSDTTDPITLLHFNTERGWFFRKRSTGASTRLTLEADVEGKSFWIGFDDGTIYAAKFSVQSVQGNCTVQLAHHVTVDGDLTVGGNNVKDSGGNVILSSDGSGYIDYLGQQGTPADNDVLAWDTATSKWVVQAQVGGVGGDWFKTITGITNDVVADASDDTLTLASGNNILSIVGTSVSDTITFTINQANISHDSIGGVSYDDHHIQKAVPSFVPHLTNGAVFSTFHSQPIIHMPLNDDDCMCRFNLRVPDEWPTGHVTIKVMYTMPATGVYSVKWVVTATEEGDNWIASGKNVLADVADDFPTGTTNTVYIKTKALTDADIKPGCSLGVAFYSDALNTPDLYIMEVWIEP